MCMSEQNVISPCISVCKTEPISGLCYGCARTIDEIKLWKNDNTTNEWKLKNIEELKKRFDGWQLDAFNQSYNSKKKNWTIIN